MAFKPFHFYAQPLDGNHVAQRFRVAVAGDRGTTTITDTTRGVHTIVATDIGSLIFQESDQTMWVLTATGPAVYKDITGAGGGGSDVAVEVSGDDTTPGDLESKTAAGQGIAISTLNPGGNEQLQITCDASAAEITYSNATSGLTATDTQAAIDEVEDRVDKGEVKDLAWNGCVLEIPSMSVTESVGVVSFNIEKSGGGDLTVKLGGTEYLYDTTPADSVTLTAGTDAAPTLNYVYIILVVGVPTLTVSTSGWPAQDHCKVATVLCQSASSLSTDAPYHYLIWLDHPDSEYFGHIADLSHWIHKQPATWLSGVAPADLVVSSPNAYISVTAGVVTHLHEQSFGAQDMQAGDPLFLVNDPTTAYKRITTFDDITQDASGGSIDNKWFPLVVWGSTCQTAASSKLFMNLPTGTYNSAANALKDLEGYSVYSIPDEFRGTGFLIARYIVQGKASGAWVQNTKEDLRGLLPQISPGRGSVVPSAADVPYDNATSGLTATDVQAAIDEVEGRLDTVEADDVAGPASATDNAVARYDGATGKLIQDSFVLVDDTGNITSVNDIEMRSLQLSDRTAPSNPGAGLGALYKKTGNDGIFWKPDAAGAEVDLTAKPKHHTMSWRFRLSAASTDWAGPDSVDPYNDVTWTASYGPSSSDPTGSNNSWIFLVPFNATIVDVHIYARPAVSSTTAPIKFAMLRNRPNYNSTSGNTEAVPIGSATLSHTTANSPQHWKAGTDFTIKSDGSEDVNAGDMLIPVFETATINNTYGMVVIRIEER